MKHLVGSYGPMKTMVCRLCHLPGHNRRTCSKREEVAKRGSVAAAKQRDDLEVKHDGRDAIEVKEDSSASCAVAAAVVTATLHASTWIHCKAFVELRKKETQASYYAKQGACPEVMSLVLLDSKPFGSAGEKMLQELFRLGPRTGSQNDGTRGGKKLEIKCARYWASTDDCRWQHLEPNHDYDAALLALLTFNGWATWFISKSRLMALRDKKIVSFQGLQGYWAKKSDLLPYLTAVHSVEELDAAIASAVHDSLEESDEKSP